MKEKEKRVFLIKEDKIVYSDLNLYIEYIKFRAKFLLYILVYVFFIYYQYFSWIILNFSHKMTSIKRR